MNMIGNAIVYPDVKKGLAKHDTTEIESKAKVLSSLMPHPAQKLRHATHQHRTMSNRKDGNGTTKYENVAAHANKRRQ